MYRQQLKSYIYHVTYKYMPSVTKMEHYVRIISLGTCTCTFMCNLQESTVVTLVAYLQVLRALKDNTYISISILLLLATHFEESSSSSYIPACGQRLIIIGFGVSHLTLTTLMTLLPLRLEHLFFTRSFNYTNRHTHVV